MHWLTNVWFVGIATGIVSGIITAWLARLLFSRRENREYQQRAASANREIVVTIRSTIPELELPLPNVVEALRESTARRYEVAVGDVFKRLELVEELIKEVMDSSFLSAARKAEYCLALMPLRLPDKSPLMEGIRPEVQLESDLDHAARLAEQRRSRVSILSVISGTIAGIGTMVSVLAFILAGKTTRVDLGLLANVPGTALLVALSLIILSIQSMYFLHRRRSRMRDKDNAAPLSNDGEKP